MEKQMIEKVIRAWLLDERVEFYSGRIMLYHLLDGLGYDAERLYKITESNRGTFSVSKASEFLGIE